MDQYDFIPSPSEGLAASGTVYADSAFATIGAGSFFLLLDPAGIIPPWKVDLTSGFKINPSASPMSPFVLGGQADGNGSVQLAPDDSATGLQKWIFSQGNLRQSGGGIWEKRQPV